MLFDYEKSIVLFLPEEYEGPSLRQIMFINRTIYHADGSITPGPILSEGEVIIYKVSGLVFGKVLDDAYGNGQRCTEKVRKSDKKYGSN